MRVIFFASHSLTNGSMCTEGRPVQKEDSPSWQEIYATSLRLTPWWMGCAFFAGGASLGAPGQVPFSTRGTMKTPVYTKRWAARIQGARKW